jgi:hypothetical protein
MHETLFFMGTALKAEGCDLKTKQSQSPNPHTAHM